MSSDLLPSFKMVPFHASLRPEGLHGLLLPDRSRQLIARIYRAAADLQTAMNPADQIFWGPAEIPELAAMGWYSAESKVQGTSYKYRTAFEPGREISRSSLTKDLKALAIPLWKDLDPQSGGLLSCPGPPFTVGHVRQFQKQLWVFLTLHVRRSEANPLPALILGIPWSAAREGKLPPSDGWELLRSVSHLHYHTESLHIKLSGKWRDQIYIFHSHGRQILPFRALYQALHTAFLLSSTANDRPPVFLLASKSIIVVSVGPPKQFPLGSTPDACLTDVLLALTIRPAAGTSDSESSVTLHLTPHHSTRELNSAREELSGSILHNGVLYFTRGLGVRTQLLYHQDVPLYLQPRLSKCLETLLWRAMDLSHLPLEVYVSNVVSTGKFTDSTSQHARGNSFVLSRLIEDDELLEELEGEYEYVSHLKHAAILERVKAFAPLFESIRQAVFNETGPVSQFRRSENWVLNDIFRSSKCTSSGPFRSYIHSWIVPAFTAFM